MLLGIHSIEDDGYVREKFGDNIKSTYERLALVRSQKASCKQMGCRSDIGLPHTVQRMNSIVASLSRTKFRLMAIADCPIMIVPM